MKIPDDLDFNINAKFYLREFKVNEIQFKCEKKIFKKIVKFCKDLTKLGYDFDLKIDKNKFSYRNGEIIEDEEN